MQVTCLRQSSSCLKTTWVGCWCVGVARGYFVFRVRSGCLRNNTLFTAFRCIIRNSQPVYKSWLPAAALLRPVVALRWADRVLVARLVATVARAYDWPVCYDATGLPLTNHFSGLVWAGDPTTALPWLYGTPAKWPHLKEAFGGIFARLRGTPLCVLCPVCGCFVTVVVFILQRRVARGVRTVANPTWKRPSDAACF